jgi:P-type Cu+ transporter
VLTTSSQTTPPARQGKFLSPPPSLSSAACTAVHALAGSSALGRVPGVASASVNLATARAFVSYHGSAIIAGELCQAVADIGYSATAVDAVAGSARRQHGDRWVLRAIISWPLAIAALLVSLLLPQTAGPGWIVLVLAAVVEFAGGWPFLRNAARLLRHGAASMDTLIAVGTLAAVAVSAVSR